MVSGLGRGPTRILGMNRRFFSLRRCWFIAAIAAGIACFVAAYVLLAKDSSLATLNGASAHDAADTLAPAWSRQRQFRVHVQPAKRPLVPGVTHEWVVVVEKGAGEPAGGCRLRFDADMPAHGHGLPTAPQVTSETAPGRYRVEGVRFSMPGHWRIMVAVSGCAGAEDSAAFDLHL